MYRIKSGRELLLFIFFITFFFFFFFTYEPETDLLVLECVSESLPTYSAFVCMDSSGRNVSLDYYECLQYV